LKIQILRKRENFLKIFQKSISVFFSKKYSHIKYMKIEYVINDYLNIIYPSNINRNDLADLVSEFKYHPKAYRRILQSAYTFLAIRRPLEIISSSELILISMPISAKERWVFIPGNHSIRVIDLDKNRCFVFLKSGFDSKFIESDVNIRLEHAWLKTPKVIQQKNGWHEEQRVVGLPWNRLSSVDLKKKVIVGVQNQLSKLYQKTVVNVPMIDYVPQLCNDILSMLEASFSSLSDEEKDIISNFTGELELLLSNYSSDVNIDLVSTHGDFQPGNILCSKDDFWIIDWEYSNQRSIFYDALVFDLECRFPSGLGARLNKKINELVSMSDYLKWTGQLLDNNKIYYFSVFFLEDLLLRMDEASADLILAKSEVLSAYLAELLIIQDVLITNIKK
jgi:hypothetical protein